jgi:hypothetical protein
MASKKRRTTIQIGSLPVGKFDFRTPSTIMPKLIVILISRRGALLYESSARAVLGISKQGPA